jgi:four helix bundle protein
MQTSRKLTNLQAWQMAMELAVFICKEIVPALPKEEQYALIDQLRRASQSIPANIAEGFGRHHFQDAVRYNYIARGSLLEVYSHITFAKKMGYLQDAAYDQLVSQLQTLHKTINGYITFLRHSKQGSTDPGQSIRETPSAYYDEENDANSF